jgi:hypothetical protein
MPVPPNKRPTYESIPGGGDDFNDLWNRTQAADDGFDPLPPGTYRCLVADGRLATAKNGTASYKVTFQVVEGPFTGRKVWHDCFLTPKALAMSKRDLDKLRIHTPEQLTQAPPTGIVADIRVVLRTESDGRTFNRVAGFKVVEDAPPPGIFDPDAQDDLSEADDDTSGADGEEVPF